MKDLLSKISDSKTLDEARKHMNDAVVNVNRNWIGRKDHEERMNLINIAYVAKKKELSQDD